MNKIKVGDKVRRLPQFPNSSFKLNQAYTVNHVDYMWNNIGFVEYSDRGYWDIDKFELVQQDTNEDANAIYNEYQF